MAFITLPPEIVKRLTDAQGVVEIRDELGRTIGTFHPAAKISPEHRAELEARRGQRAGRKLSDVIAELRSK